MINNGDFHLLIPDDSNYYYVVLMFLVCQLPRLLAVDVVTVIAGGVSKPNRPNAKGIEKSKVICT